MEAVWRWPEDQEDGKETEGGGDCSGGQTEPRRSGSSGRRRSRRGRRRSRSGPPEGVERRLAPDVAGAGQLGVALVDRLPGSGARSRGTTRRCAGSARQPACHSGAESAVSSSRLNPPGIRSWTCTDETSSPSGRDAEPAVELDAGRHVPDDEVHHVQVGRGVPHRRSLPLFSLAAGRCRRRVLSPDSPRSSLRFAPLRPWAPVGRHPPGGRTRRGQRTERGRGVGGGSGGRSGGGRAWAG